VYYRQQILIQRAAEAVTKDTGGPSDAEISSYYDANRASFNQEETRTARHILIAPAVSGTQTSTSETSTSVTLATEAEWAAALTKAEKVRADLVGGADWKTEAAEYSDDPGSKNSAGDLGTIKKGQMVAEFDQAVFSLAKDEISQPVKTVYGYHIIQVTGITPAKQETLDEAKATIQSKLLQGKKTQAWKDWRTSTRAALKVVVAPGLEITTTTTGGASTTTPTS
jgi:parvulin-like peptidyl-prolyl isomerase